MCSGSAIACCGCCFFHFTDRLVPSERERLQGPIEDLIKNYGSGGALQPTVPVQAPPPLPTLHLQTCHKRIIAKLGLAKEDGVCRACYVSRGQIYGPRFPPSPHP